MLNAVRKVSNTESSSVCGMAHEGQPATLAEINPGRLWWKCVKVLHVCQIVSTAKYTLQPLLRVRHNVYIYTFQMFHNLRLISCQA